MIDDDRAFMGYLTQFAVGTLVDMSLRNDTR